MALRKNYKLQDRSLMLETLLFHSKRPNKLIIPAKDINIMTIQLMQIIVGKGNHLKEKVKKN